MRSALHLWFFAVCLLSSAVAAQTWPAKPVRVIAPFAAGGAADTLGRTIGAKLTDSLGQNFVVENRAGAGGVIGSDIAAKSAPDGYTLVNDYSRLYNSRMVIDACRPYEQLDSFPKVCQSSPELAAKVRAQYPELYR